VSKSTFTNNKAKSTGGTICGGGNNAIKVIDSKFNKNIAGKKYNAIHIKNEDKKNKIKKYISLIMEKI